MPDTPLTLSPAALLIDLPPGILCGIDLLSFTTSGRFRGIKDLPPGWHFIYTSETASLSIREGFWFEIPNSASWSQPPLIIRIWDAKLGVLTPCPENAYASYRAQLSSLWVENLTPYRQSAGNEPGEESGDWAELTADISPGLLTRFTGNPEWIITSASCAKQDRDEIPGLTAGEAIGNERELGVLGIDLKRTWRHGAVGRERTEGATDKSWALEDLVARWREEGEEWGKIIMGVMEVCFLMVLTVANFSCLEEWKRVLGLVLTCKTLVKKREAWFARFLEQLRKQLARGDDVEGGLFDMSDEGGAYLKDLLKGFKRNLEQTFDEAQGERVREAMQELESFLKAEYGWELSDSFVRRGLLELEDGEQVEMEMDELLGEDERGEYAPVVVDLG
jgi:A1 cistron-splicing factor AAR2